MLMRYHWGLGIGHQYAHSTTISMDSQCSSSPESHPTGRNIENYKHLVDEDNEGDDNIPAADSLDFESESEPDSEFDEQSGSESILGDHADMYGWGGLGLDPSTELYEF